MIFKFCMYNHKYTSTVKLLDFAMYNPKYTSTVNLLDFANPKSPAFLSRIFSCIWVMRAHMTRVKLPTHARVVNTSTELSADIKLRIDLSDFLCSGRHHFQKKAGARTARVGNGRRQNKR